MDRSRRMLLYNLDLSLIDLSLHRCYFAPPKYHWRYSSGGHFLGNNSVRIWLKNWTVCRNYIQRKCGAGTRQLAIDKAVMDKRFVDSLKLKDSLFITNFTVCIVEDLKVLSGTRLGQDVFPGLRSKWYENNFEFPTSSTSIALQTS